MSAYCAKPLNLGRTIYLVLCDYGESGLEWAARAPERTNRDDTITDIRTGELPNVKCVAEMNICEFTSRNVTEDILKDAGRWDHNDPPLFGTDRIEWLQDHERKIRAEEA